MREQVGGNMHLYDDVDTADGWVLLARKPTWCKLYPVGESNRTLSNPLYKAAFAHVADGGKVRSRCSHLAVYSYRIQHKLLITLSETAQHLSDLELPKNLVALCRELQYSLWRRSALGDIVTGAPISDCGLARGQSACARRRRSLQPG